MENIVTIRFPVPIGKYMGKNPMSKSDEGHGDGFSGGFGSIEGSGYGERMFNEGFLSIGDGSGYAPGKGCLLGTGTGIGTGDLELVLKIMLRMD